MISPNKNNALAGSSLYIAIPALCYWGWPDDFMFVKVYILIWFVTLYINTMVIHVIRCSNDEST